MKKIILLTLLCVLSSTVCGQKRKISVLPTPKWVENVEKTPKENPNKGNSSGYYYNLIDFQTNVDKKSYFTHYTIEILNNEGIQQIADIQIDFDPSYQKLILHKIDIIRDGQTIKKLSLNTIKTVQRETDMERFLYNGTLTAYCNLTDVRIGDFVDYSYTIVGSNPIYENHFHTKIYFQHSIPIGCLSNRILSSDNKNLYFKYFNNAKKPIVSESDGFKEYLWKQYDVTPILYDRRTPSWYDPLPRVSITEYNSWKEIVKQYAKHYEINSSEKEKFKDEALSLFGSIPKDSIINTIRKFVQDDVRYLGFENGLNSHKPDQPLNVLRQRYGDCKAKSFLMVELLKLFDVEAYPTLVHSYNGKSILEDLPSPNLFNHCIVQIKSDYETYYIDPTISNQGGPIQKIITPNYQTGLVLKPGEQGLSKIKFNPNSKTSIVEEYDIEEIGGTGYLYITTTYTGSDADDQRAYFAKRDLQKIQKEYIDFYSAMHPSIREFSKIEFIDHRDLKNEVVIKESYFIDSLWTKSAQDNGLLLSEFYPLNIETYVNLQKSPERTMPYYVSYPVDIEHKIRINLPEKWNVNPRYTEMDEDSFYYSFKEDYSDKTITLTHTYRTKKDHLKPNQVNTFIEKHEKIMDKLAYELSYRKSFDSDGSESSETSWFLIMIFLLVIFFGSFFAYKIYTSYDITTSHQAESGLAIGGWLILIAIGLIITPLRLCTDFIRSREDFFGIHVWNFITQDHESFSDLFSSLLIIFELIYNAAFLVFSVLVIFLFFNKRSILPRMIIIFYAASFLIPTLDSIIAFSINERLYSEPDKVEAFKEAGTSFIKAAIWIPYFIVSRRVKSTFTKKYKEEENIL